MGLLNGGGTGVAAGEYVLDAGPCFMGRTTAQLVTDEGFMCGCVSLLTQFCI